MQNRSPPMHAKHFYRPSTSSASPRLGRTTCTGPCTCTQNFVRGQQELLMSNIARLCIPFPNSRLEKVDVRWWIKSRTTTAESVQAFELSEAVFIHLLHFSTESTFPGIPCVQCRTLKTTFICRARNWSKWTNWSKMHNELALRWEIHIAIGECTWLYQEPKTSKNGA